ncbi:MAG: hemolysin secretion protein D [Planctomycetota bacterium]
MIHAAVGGPAAGSLTLRHVNRFLLLIPLALIAVAALALSQRSGGPPTVSGIIEAHDIRLGSRVGGRVREVGVEEGQAVARGDALVVLEPYDLNERLAGAEAALGAARARLARLEAGFRDEEKAQARAARDRYKSVLEKLRAGLRPLELQIYRDKLAVAEADLSKAQFDYEKIKHLDEQGNAAPDEMVERTRALEVARARLAQARDELALAEEGTRAEEVAEAAALLAGAEAALQLAETGSRPEEIAEARANVDAADASVAAVRRQLEELTIVAPGAGVVEAVELRPGDLIPANAPVVTLLDLSDLWVRAYVPERSKLAVGAEVEVRVDALGARTLKGRVSFIAREAEFMPSNVQTPEERSKQVFRIKVELRDEKGELRPGMAVDVILPQP